MQDKENFLEALKRLEERAAQQNGLLSAADVQDALGQFAAGQEQQAAVCRYLAGQGIRVEGLEAAVQVQGNRTEEDLDGEDRAVYQQYRRLLGQPGRLGGEECRQMLRALAERGACREQVIGFYQEAALETAVRYAGRGILLEDLIQEANIGLMMAVDSLGLREDQVTEDEYIREGIEGALRQLLEEEEDARQKDSQILERMDRIGAGIRELSDELGRKVTLEEIAGYLDMPQEEVKDLLKLTGETFEDGQEQDRGQGGQEDGALTFGVEDFQIF